MFDGFTLQHIDVGDAVLRVRHGGSGPAVLLLHGHPRTHATWHRVAPLLEARGHDVVTMDLPVRDEDAVIDTATNRVVDAIGDLSGGVRVNSDTTPDTTPDTTEG